MADVIDILAFLEDLAGNVKRQIRRIDDPPDEPEIERHQLFGIVHDEDAADIELDTVSCVAIPKIKRRTRRHIEQLGVFLLTFNPGMGPA